MFAYFKVTFSISKLDLKLMKKLFLATFHLYIFILKVVRRKLAQNIDRYQRGASKAQ